MGKKPIADEDIRKLNGVMKKYPRAKKEGDKFYIARICEIAGTRQYCVRTLQAIRHVDGDPAKYREYTEKRRNRPGNGKIDEPKAVFDKDPAKDGVFINLLARLDELEKFVSDLKSDTMWAISIYQERKVI